MKVTIGKYPKKSDKERKVSIRIDPWDTWSMDSTLALIVVPMLKQLRATKHGTPMDAFEEEWHQITQSKEFFAEKKSGPLHKKAKRLEKEGLKRWDDILGKMIWSFEQANKHWDNPKLIGDKDYWARVQEGIDLFAKHYFDLWD